MGSRALGTWPCAGGMRSGAAPELCGILRSLGRRRTPDSDTPRGPWRVIPRLTRISARRHRPPDSSPAQSPRGRFLPDLRFPGAPVAAALALVLLPLLSVVPGAHAGVLVQNVDQPAADAENFDEPRVGHGQQFTTGSNPLGYGLGSVGVVFEAAPSAAQLANLSVSIWSSLESGGQNNNPDSQLYALSTPTSITAGSVALFTAPEGTRLAPNTSYVVAVLRSGTLAGVQLGTTSTNMKDSGAAPGWSILNTLHRRFTSGGQTVWEPDLHNRELRIQVRSPDGPGLVSVTIDERWLELTFDKDLDETSAPSSGDFAFEDFREVSGVERWRPVSSRISGQIHVAGRTVTLPFIVRSHGYTGDPLRVSYTGSAIRDRTGNSAPGFAEIPVAVLTENDGPRLLQANIDGTEVSLFFDQALNTSYVPAAGRFDVRHEGNPVEVTATRVPSSRTVKLTLARAAVYGDSAWSVSYDGAAGTLNRIRGAGNDGVYPRSFSGRMLQTVTAPPQAPRLLRALWYERGGVELRYDQTLTPTRSGNGAPPASAYTVTVNGTSVSVGGVSIGQASVGLDVQATDLADAPPCSVLVTYRVPADNAITGLANGQQAAAIDAQPAARVNRGGSFASCGMARPLVSASDASATEGIDTTADFVVSLYPAATETVTVDYATEGGTATAGADYTSASGTLTFAVGETSKTVSVTIVDDTVEDRGESFQLILSNLSGGGAYLKDRTGKGVIYNDEDEAALSAAAPYVTGAELAPDESGDGVWSGGETVEARLTFSEPVAVAGGVPRLHVRIAGLPVWVDYRVGSGSATLAFAIEVPAGTRSFSDAMLLADSLTLNGAAIVSRASGLAAELEHDGAEPAPAAGGSNALTAAFHDLPEAHDGSEFTFELRFSEEFPLSFRTLLDHAFGVTGGALARVSRVTSGANSENRAWSVTVNPAASTVDVTVTLAATADCGAAGAICAGAGARSPRRSRRRCPALRRPCPSPHSPRRSTPSRPPSTTAPKRSSSASRSARTCTR